MKPTSLTRPVFLLTTCFVYGSAFLICAVRASNVLVVAVLVQGLAMAWPYALRVFLEKIIDRVEFSSSILGISSIAMFVASSVVAVGQMFGAGSFCDYVAPLLCLGGACGFYALKMHSPTVQENKYQTLISCIVAGACWTAAIGTSFAQLIKALPLLCPIGMTFVISSCFLGMVLIGGSLRHSDCQTHTNRAALAPRQPRSVGRGRLGCAMASLFAVILIGICLLGLFFVLCSFTSGGVFQSAGSDVRIR